MTQALSETTLQTIEATVPALREAGGVVVATMYKHLLSDPQVRVLFNMSNQTGDSPQHQALAGAILAYAENIRQPEVLLGAIERIAQKHVSFQILPEHYEAVAAALLTAIKDVLGEAATPAILEAWGEAYWLLANILIGREEQLYKGAATAAGGWRGWRTFEVAEKRQEAVDITSFLLRPIDGKPVMAHQAGQYLTLLVPADPGAPVRRNYSISCAPNNTHYRITVKRAPQGVASGWLHDTAQVGSVIEAAAPAGHFYLEAQDKAEIVLVSGGVGLTPMVSMLEAQAGKGVPITYVHATRDGAHHAMGEHHRSLSDRSIVFFDAPRNEDEPGRDFDHQGQINADWLAAQTRMDVADYYVCGPLPFMRAIVTGLKAKGVAASRIHYEFFGPESESF
ncbi:NO-inducible flavohemoprotein [Epibacterium ulvae]|uniref:NO-inducible flavohemoprotein n=1 Tax=Epibacterium ulvae TaxID=1156985 RepID=UPI001BFC82D9|nr:NO-inducible flavohemoprotein [Epibacterium ulvae]MBT8155685.1 NO-inducible flavohemoprotein [Epibacterium ulvae]